jgi:hypothetical protein
MYGRSPNPNPNYDTAGRPIRYPSAPGATLLTKKPSPFQLTGPGPVNLFGASKKSPAPKKPTSKKTPTAKKPAPKTAPVAKKPAPKAAPKKPTGKKK